MASAKVKFLLNCRRYVEAGAADGVLEVVTPFTVRGASDRLVCFRVLNRGAQPDS